ncbi:hypothetical protein MNBD_IGNAVI01-313 [hydrothermal vent metagenome]|uniref:HTH araC/xylS-type domain-containing protein n=1 Tax=hydrothermal vent metagenome TaxID=652676 RepID=A0A3B1CUU4_9ZZZZ
MQDIYIRNGGKPDNPHRHEYYTALIVEEGQGSHVIDFNNYKLQNNLVYFISPGQVHQLIEKKQPKGFALLFSTEFLMENNIPLSFINNLNLFKDYSQNPPLEIDAGQLKKLLDYCSDIYAWDQSSLRFKGQAIGSLLKLLLIECNNFCNTSFGHSQNIETGNVIYKNFKNLVDQNYARWHATSDYAKGLFVTPDHLNRIVKLLTGKTAKEFIQSRISIEAKRMLYFSDLSAKEIGYKLGFFEPANFSAFFKKCTGKSPSQFRKKQ